MVDALALYDLDAFGTELDDPLAELAQDLVHRTLEVPGSNLDDRARGYGLVQRLSGSGPPATIGDSMRYELEAEYRKDIRVSDAAVTVTETARGEYLLEASIVPNADELGIVLSSDPLTFALEANASGARRVS